MDEFLKINWRIKSASEFEETTERFISEEVISESLVYKNFVCPIAKNVKKPKKAKRSSESQGIFIPGYGLLARKERKSSLTIAEHEICVKALKLIQSGKDLNNLCLSNQNVLKVYNRLKPKILKENERYLQLASQYWNKDKMFLSKLRYKVFNKSRYLYQRRFYSLQYYPDIYKEVGQLNMTYTDTDDAVDFNCIQNMLELGTLARYSQPSFKTKCTLKVLSLPVKEEIKVNSKLPVSEDENITKLLENSNIDVVISSGGLKRLTDNTDLKETWIIPVCIKELEVKQGETSVKKKVVFIDKPIPKLSPNPLDLAYYINKKLIKTNFCQYEAFEFPGEDIPVKTEKKRKTEQGNAPETSDKADILKRIQELEKDMLLDTDSESEYESDQIDADNPNKKKEAKENNKIHHNVNYRIWKIKSVNEDHNNLMKNKQKNVDINVLIRSKLDACETTEFGALQPVTLVPKVERQIKFGFNIPTKSELVREWTTLFFRPFSNLYRVRLHSRTGEVICVEKCTLQKVVSEATLHYNIKPQMGLGILQKVFTQLLEYQPGNYLLRHLPKHESFVSVMKSCDESAPDCYDLKEDHKVFEVDKTINESWLPIDINYFMPYNDVFQEMPGMFRPRQTNVNKGKKGFKPNKTKKKKKNKKKQGKEKEAITN